MNQHNPHDSLNSTTKRQSSWFFLVLLILAVIGAVFYYQRATSTKESKTETPVSKRGHGGHYDEDKPAVVSVETATQTDFPVYLTGLGSVTALRTVTVKPKVDGELIRIAFTEGQMVKAGDLLAEIDPRPLQIQLQQVEGQLLRDAALLKNAELDQIRYQTLLEQDSIAAQQTKTQEAQVKQYKGIVEMDTAQVNNAKLQLSYTRLTAPISGRVGLRQIDEGNIVHASDAKGLVVITQLQPISVVFTLPEDKIPAVMQRWHSNQSMQVEVYDRAGKIKLATGKLQAIDNQIDPTTGTLKFKAQFDNTDLSLFANQFVNIKMQLETLKKVTLVASAAIQNDTQGAFVYVVKDNKAQSRHVTLGPTEGERVAILANLAANEMVVIEGFDSLRDGSQVDIAQKDGQAVAALLNAHPKPDGKPPKSGRHP
jgi:membrane fusion protein, multidrug efflux system